MKSLLAYVRNLLGWCDEDPTIRTSFKRDRADDECSSDDDTPAVKRLRQLKRTSFPEAMATQDIWHRDEKEVKNVRYVPIEIERGHPSTSTPIELTSKLGNRVRAIPVKLVNENGTTPARPKPRMHTPVKPVIHTLVDDDDDQEITFIENPERSKQKSDVYIELEDEDTENEQQDNDVVFVKKVTTPPAVKPYKYFVSKNSDIVHSRDGEPVQYLKLTRKLNNANTSLRTYSKFKAPAGITKTYKKAPTPVARWMQTQKNQNLLQSRNRYINLNGSGRSTLSEVFNLDEKRNYQELIKRVSGTVRPVSLSKPIDIINLSEDSASFRLTQRSQKKALDDIRFVEKGIRAEKDIEINKEYDPMTVASINSSDSEVEIVPSESSTTSSTKIDPVNTFRDSLKDRAVTSDDWLAKLDKKYRTKKLETQEKLRDARRESDIISKVNSEQKIAHLEHKLKYELSIPESLFEEAQPTVELPPLSPEEEKLVNRALGPGPPGQLLVEKFNLRIHRRDLQTLSGLNWLNDEVINFYMNLLMQRSEEKKDLPKVYATNTFFYPKLMQSGQAGLRRWTRKVDIFAHDLLVLPVHLGVHWCLSIVDFKQKRVMYLDSMGGRNQACLEALMQYLRDEHQDKKGQPFDDKGWKAECLKDIPQQMNGSDCGMFACTFAEFAARGAPWTFTQANMPYLRRKAALEILRGKLML